MHTHNNEKDVQKLTAKQIHTDNNIFQFGLFAHPIARNQNVFSKPPQIGF
jgi:hypothetical protein